MEPVTHTVSIEQCKRITATGIISVDAFSEKQIILTYQEGRIVVGGSGMKITGFSKTGGNFSASGNIGSLRYIPKGTSLKRKIFG